MKKLLVCLMVVFCLFLVACGGGNSGNEYDKIPDTMESADGKYEIAFAEVRSFEIEKLRIWGYKYNSSNITVRLVNGRGFVKVIDAYNLTMPPKQLCDLLNERLSMTS